MELSGFFLYGASLIFATLLVGWRIEPIKKRMIRCRTIVCIYLLTDVLSRFRSNVEHLRTVIEKTAGNVEALSVAYFLPETGNNILNVDFLFRGKRYRLSLPYNRRARSSVKVIGIRPDREEIEIEHLPGLQFQVTPAMLGLDSIAIESGGNRSTFGKDEVPH